MSNPADIPNHLPREEVMSFVDAAKTVIDFEQVLLKHGITVAAKSDLEQQCLALLHWEDRRTGKVPFDPYGDPRAEVRSGVGALHLFKLILDAESKAGVSPLVSHLRKLNDEKAVVAQGTKAPFSDSTNKLFELFLGAVCLNCATEVVLDDPDHSSGTNPDVLFTFEGRRWGLACKVSGGPSPLTLYERVEEGIRQVEASPAESGFVVINMRNQIDHDAMWPMQEPGNRSTGEAPTFGGWVDDELATAALLRMSMAKLRSFLDDNGEEAIQRLVAQSRAQPAVLLFLQTTIMVRILGVHVPTRLSRFHRWDLDLVSDGANECLFALNNALHHRP